MTWTAALGAESKRRRWSKGAITAGVMMLMVLFLACGQSPLGQTDQASSDFLKKHWQLPVPPQGRPPATFSALEASLDPATCGACHPEQFNDWKTTVHSRSASPGLLAQTVSMLQEEPETAVMCYTCHTPLSEQQEVIQTMSGLKKNPDFDADLQRHGLTCAGCHVRRYQRFGPPQRDGSLKGNMPPDRAPHGGATRTPAFERAEFCMGCHQFEEDDFALNGKLLENTYQEWKNGPYAAQGIACQHCHMPDRRHLWRGIHDPEMVSSGVTVELQTNQPHYEVGQQVEASLILTNSGVGHYFPSYVTPKVILCLELIDAGGHPLLGSLQQEAVNRQVPLDLSEEVHDTRIAPKGKHTMRYAHLIDRKGLRLRAVVTVYPDEFYQRFFEAKLAGQLSPEERKTLSQALEETRRSSFKIFEKVMPLS